MSKCECCQSESIVYMPPGSNTSICVSCLFRIFEENVSLSLVKELNLLRERNAFLEQENKALRAREPINNVIRGCYVE